MIEHFHRPRTVREALALKRRLQGRATFLAGGTRLNSSESGPPPEHFISLEGLGLDRIETKRGQVVIGALCTLQAVLEDRRVPAALKAAVAQVASRNVRNAATIGGHIASNLPWSDVIPMLVALEAKLGLARPGGAATIAVADYVARRPPGLITRIVVARPAAGRLTACRNARASANARSIVSAAVSLALSRQVVRQPVVALGGVAEHVQRLTAVEAALEGKPLPSSDEIQALVGRSVRAREALSGSAAFRTYQAGAVVALALRDAARGREARA